MLGDNTTQDALQQIIKAQKVMKIGNPGNKKFWPYQKGDQVWIKGTDIKTVFATTKLAPKQYGPFMVLEPLSDAMYQVEIPWQRKIHNIFHANLLMPYKETKLHRPNFTWPPSDLINGEPEYKVEKILDKRSCDQGHKMKYLIKWKGYPTSDNSWVKEEDIHMPELIVELEQWRNKTNNNKTRRQ